MSSFPENKDRLVVGDAKERAMVRANVPRALWYPDLKLVRFKKTKYAAEELPSSLQKHWVGALLNEPIRTSPLVVVSSAPTDTGAQYLAHYIFGERMRGKKSPSAGILDVGNTRTIYPEEYPATLMLTNILAGATEERIQKTRDLLLRFKHAFRLVVVAGAEHPYQWCTGRLGLRPTTVFNVADMEFAL